MYDVITVGGASVDVFVRASRKQEEFFKHGEHVDVAYHVGEKVLVRGLHFHTGGGGTNSATAFARLGLKTGWVGKLGDDHNGDLVERVMKREGVGFLGRKGKGMTGYSVILIGLNHDRTILAYKGINDKLRVGDVSFDKLKTKWFYLSALIGESFETLKKIASYAQKNKIKCGFNASMYLANKGVDHLRPVLRYCDLLVLNKEEAQAMLGVRRQEDYLLKGLKEVVEGIVVITDGPKGAYAYDGEHKYALVPRKVKVVETTGAGDAFASGVLAGLHLKNDLEYALQLGFAEASSVIGYLGAKDKLLSLREANRLIRNRPARIKKVKL